MDLPCEEIADFDLIRRMADQKSDFAAAKHAWECFYVRHRRILMYICNSDHGYLLGQDDVKDIVHDTFLKAFTRAASFNFLESCEPAVQEKKCRAWLATIATNTVRDRFRGQPEISILDATELEQIESPLQENSDEMAPEPVRLSLLNAGFAGLSEIEQTVLRATMSWWRPGEKYQRMPNAAMQELSRQIDKSPENIRKIRSRAVEKLEKYVSENVRDEEN